MSYQALVAILCEHVANYHLAQQSYLLVIMHQQ